MSEPRTIVRLLANLTARAARRANGGRRSEVGVYSDYELVYHVNLPPTRARAKLGAR